MQTAAGQLMRLHGRGARGVRPQETAGASPVAAPATPKEQLMARKLAEADRRMREVTLQVRTTIHDKERARARKQHMLQGTMHSPAAAEARGHQQRSSSCHGGMLDLAEDPEGNASPGLRDVKAKSTSGMEPASLAQSGPWNARPLGGVSEPPAERRRGNGDIEGMQRAGTTAHDDRIACSGTNSYRIAGCDDEEAWAQENADILASAHIDTPGGGMCDHPARANRMMACATGACAQGRLSELVIPRVESAVEAPCASVLPSDSPSASSSPPRFGMDTIERRRLTPAFGGGGAPSPAFASPLTGSPAIRFGTGPPGAGGFEFALPGTPAGVTTAAALTRRRVSGEGCDKGTTPPAGEAADVHASSSTDYSEDYSEVRAMYSLRYMLVLRQIYILVLNAWLEP